MRFASKKLKPIRQSTEKESVRLTDDDDEDQEKKAEEIVVLIFPNSLQKNDMHMIDVSNDTDSFPHREDEE